MSDQERFEESLSRIYATRGYLVAGVDEPLPVGYILRTKAERGAATINQPLRVIERTDVADYRAQCALVGWNPKTHSLYFCRVESD